METADTDYMQMLTVLGMYISLWGRIHSKFSENFRVRIFFGIRLPSIKLNLKTEVEFLQILPVWTSLYIMLLISDTVL